MPDKTSYGKDLGETLMSARETMSVYSVRLTAYHSRMARRAGLGNLSEGLRIAVEEWVSHHKCADNKKPASSGL